MAPGGVEVDLRQDDDVHRPLAKLGRDRPQSRLVVVARSAVPVAFGEPAAVRDVEGRDAERSWLEGIAGAGRGEVAEPNRTRADAATAREDGGEQDAQQTRRA